MLLTKYFELKLTNNLTNKFKPIYDTLINDNNFNSFLINNIELFKKDILLTEEFDSRQLIQKNDYNRKIKAKIFNSLIKNICNNIKIESNPKNTFNKFINRDNNIEIKNTAPKEIYETYLIYNQLKILNKEDIIKELFNNQYNSKSFNEFLNKKIEEIFLWSRNNNECICSYKYIKTYYNKKEILKWFLKDIYLDNYKFLKENIKKNKNNSQKSLNIYPLDYNIKHPIDASNRKKTNQLEGSSYVYVHEAKDGDIEIKTFIDIPKSHLTNGIPKLYNLFDNEVIKGLIKLSNSDFWVTYIVDCDLSEIVHTISNNPGGKIYDQVYDSLTKMSSYKSIHKNIKTKEYLTYEIYTANIYNPNGNKFDYKKTSNISKYKGLRVKVTFNRDYITHLINSSVFTDDNSENILESNLARALIVPLQGVRYTCFNNKNLIISLGYYSFFCVRLILSKNKSRELKRLESALEDIIKTKTILKSAIRNKDIFTLEFLPLQKDEKESILEYLENLAQKGILLNLPFDMKKQ